MIHVRGESIHTKTPCVSWVSKTIKEAKVVVLRWSVGDLWTHKKLSIFQMLRHFIVDTLANTQTALSKTNLQHFWFFVHFGKVSLQAKFKDDAAMDCCGCFSLCGDWSSCHSLFAFHLSQKVNDSADWWNNGTQACLASMCLYNLHVEVEERLGLTFLWAALAGLFCQKLWWSNYLFVCLWL